jgi:hypothetical protein
MKKMVTSALVAAAALAGTGVEADAQTGGPTVFDLGIYAGGSWTTSWFEIGDEGYQVGFGPIFGATATYWATPGFGVRLHGAYFPTQLPQGDSEAGFEDGNDEYVMNNYLYDLNLVFRPAFLSATVGSFLANPYLFLGGGGLTTNIAGLPAARGGVGYPCVNTYRSAGVCLSQDPEYASVGQGNIGIGFDLLSLAGLGVFGELAVHGYDSPAHVYNENTAQDKFAFTPRASLGLKFGFGAAAPEEVIVPPVAPPPPPPALPAAPEMQTIRVCVVEGTALREVEAMYNPATGDTTVAGQAFATAYPATTGYAGGATWYINNEAITINRRRYVRFGLPRVVSPTDVTRTGEYQGVGVFTDASATGTPDVIYIPVRPGCEFQPFQYEVPARGVRG